MKTKNELKRRDALTIFSIMYAYAKEMKVNSLCYLALQKEKNLCTPKDIDKASKKVMIFFENIPNEFNDLNEEDGINTVLNFVLGLVNYLSKYRGRSVFYTDDILAGIKKEINNCKSDCLDKSTELLILLEIA